MLTAPLTLSVIRYTHLLRLIESTRDFEEQEQVERADSLKAALTSNLALAAFNQEEYVRCIEWCDKTLQADPNNAKVGKSSCWAQPPPECSAAPSWRALECTANCLIWSRLARPVMCLMMLFCSWCSAHTCLPANSSHNLPTLADAEHAFCLSKVLLTL